MKTYSLKTLFDSVLHQEVPDAPVATSATWDELLKLIETLRPQFPDTPEVDALLNWITRNAPAADPAAPTGDPPVVGTAPDVPGSLGESPHASGISVSDEHPFGAPGDSSVTSTAPAASSATWDAFLNLIETLRPQFPDTPEVDALLNWITRDAPAADPAPTGDPSAVGTASDVHSILGESPHASGISVSDEHPFGAPGDSSVTPTTAPAASNATWDDFLNLIETLRPQFPDTPEVDALLNWITGGVSGAGTAPPDDSPAIGTAPDIHSSVMGQSAHATGISVSDEHPFGGPGDSSVMPIDASAALHAHAASWFMI